ncbi:hypothetical protein DRP04_01915 [Archaeoglobales archaeon]|mgnify:CR=1 FL=1|nr:MAG: hypothetical protein DRP04_01915 [Archaeoglobales archaeon]
MDWEIYKIENRELSAEIESGRIKLIKSLVTEGFAARVILNGRVGFASSTSEKEALELAQKIARISEDKLEDFPVEKPTKVDGIYFKEVEEVNSDFIKDQFEILISSIERSKVASAILSYEVTSVSIKNSYGLDCHERSTYSSMLLEVVHNGGSAYQICEGRSSKLNIEETAKKAERLAIISSKSKKIESGLYDVVLMPLAVHQLFFYSLYPSFSAENVSKGRSQLAKGKKIGELTLVDDPTLPNGLMSCSFDDEGVASKRTILLDRGIVKSFYSDWKYGKILGEITGNGFREECSMPPSPSPSNVLFDVRTKSDLDGALVIHSLIGAHTSNPISGEFSLECLNAEFNGDGIKGAMIYGNIFGLVKNLEGSVGEVEQVENTVTAGLRFRRVRVVS